MVGREEEDYPDEVEERLVNEEYKIWKKNTPFLYGKAVMQTITFLLPSVSSPDQDRSHASCDRAWSR